jgi:hypothetical protein
LQPVTVVEREDGHVDLEHDLPQQGRRIDGAESLVLQRVDERVDLEHDITERAARLGGSGAQ